MVVIRTDNRGYCVDIGYNIARYVMKASYKTWWPSPTSFMRVSIVILRPMIT